ncbi:FUSC family protein [Limobrevibacterium gyesilva]|uniref:FUSC family protein n=1 Tax=Limobrevibacterium gyesilva TaxID=2991712 RepID=A0AA42CD86_9PROT|nr:FUSC family protein [Limobrevibacterium gyesilva]MCW3473434.1 FUSC family protein [Limobrevibacterium gyesilva]
MTVSAASYLARHRVRLWVAARMMISTMLAYALAVVLQLPQGYWAVLTTIIVTQNSIGGSLKAAMDRLVGSVCGALVGTVAAVLLTAHTPVAIGLALVAALTPLVLLTAFVPDYRVAPITAIIVLLSTGAATQGPLGYAFDRLLEIMLGSVIGVVVAVLIAPARAYAQVREAAGETALLLAQIMTALGPAVHAGAPDLGGLPARVQAALNRLGTAAEEAARERRSRLSDHPDPEPLFRTLRRLQQDILAMNRMFGAPWPEHIQFALAPSWSAYAEAVAAELRALAAALPVPAPPPDSPTPRTAMAAFIAAIETVRREGLTRELPTDAVGRILGSAFRAEQLQRDLDDLAERTRGVAAPAR